MTAPWLTPGTAYGAWLTADSPLVLETLVRAGVDYVGIDCQHSLMDENAAGRLLRPFVESEVGTIVRVAGKDPFAIGVALDAGADGVIVPMVDTAEQAAAAVAACRYPPRGARSFGPQHPALGADAAAIEARASCFVMIETEQGIANVEEICAVPGVTGTYVGPVDLSIALGVAPFADPPEQLLVDSIARIRAASQAAGIVPGIHALSARRAAQLGADGFGLISLRADVVQLMEAVQRDLAIARGSGIG